MEVWLNDVNEYGLFAGILLVLLVAAEVGFWLARRVYPEGDVPAHVGSIQGAVLGLLALLLGFTFSLAIVRFETRKELLRDEANAIGTAYLRAELLPEPMRTRVPTLLRSYVDTRIELSESGFSREHLPRVQARATALIDQLWREAVAAARTNPESVMVALFVDSLNETIDMHGKRVAAIRNHIPAWIFIMLFVVAVVSLGLTGYASGRRHAPSSALNALIALMVTAVALLVFDLHRPNRGFIVVSLASMTDLRDSMHQGR